MTNRTVLSFDVAKPLLMINRRILQQMLFVLLIETVRMDCSRSKDKMPDLGVRTLRDVIDEIVEIGKSQIEGDDRIELVKWQGY